MLQLNQLFNQNLMNVSKYFGAVCLLGATYTVNAATVDNIQYNTMQKHELALSFKLSEAIKNQPTVKTQMQPAQIQVTFDADQYAQQLAHTTIEHAGVKGVDFNLVKGQAVATIALDKLGVFDVAQTGDTFTLRMNDDLVANNSAKASAKATGAYINNINNIDFRLTDTKAGQLVVALDDSMVAVDVNDKLGKISVEFHNTDIPESLLYTLDVTDFGTLVKQIETFKQGKNAKLVITTQKGIKFEHQQLGNLFTLTVSKQDKKTNYLGEAKDYKGQALSLNFQDITVRTALQIIADANGFNLITSDTVGGNITLRLDGVPWDQALDIILKVKGLDKRMEGNILLVAPSDELAAREAKELQAKQQVADLAPLYSEYVQINYAKAADLAGLIKNEDTSILSKRGTVTVDERTNTLLIRDTAQSIEDIKRMVNVLDVPVRQVVIESRMVTVKDNVNEELGIRWGVTSTDNESSVSGTIAGNNSANAGSLPSVGDRMNVNLPVANPAGSLAFQVARLADGTILDLELSALEKENKGEIIASPRITTANQKEAFIEQGVEIPYQQAASSGATAVSFKKAVLSLTVTPHITPDNRIILDLSVTQDTVSSVTNGTAPAIDTQRIGTQVLVNNGETIVLGGIYQQQTINTVSKVPVLGDVPYFGWLFRNKNNFNEKKELLIFVTPRIVTDRF